VHDEATIHCSSAAEKAVADLVLVRPMVATTGASSRRDYSRHVGIGLVALAALVVLFLSVRPLGNHAEYSRQTRVRADIQGLNTQLKLYYEMNGFFPTTAQGLHALVQRPTTSPLPSRWFQLYSDLPKDTWENQYVYRCPGTKHRNTYDLFSPGRDHKPDTKDDDWGE
jgi:general secretion pathway protein G